MPQKTFRNIQKFSVTTLVITIILILVVSIVLTNVNFFINQTAHTNEVITITSRIQQSILRTETSLRAFAITSNPAFYDDYKTEKQNTWDRIDLLEKKISDNPTQILRLDSLKGLIRLRFAGLDSTADFAFNRVNSGEKLVIDRVNQSRNLSSRIRTAIDQMTELENFLLKERSGKLENNLNLLIPFLIIGFAIGLIASILNFIAVRHFEKSQVSANEKIRAYQEQLKEQITNLARVNKDLEQFSYVASHDLQEPLRKIMSFGELLQESNITNLDEDGKMYVEKIMSSSARMRVLIQDLLNYSRAGRMTIDDKQVDLNKVALEVVDDLALMIKEKKASLVIDRLPRVPGNFTLFKQVFQNLITNAIKFSQPGLPPNIMIQGVPMTPKGFEMMPDKTGKTSYTLISVQDNGIGFESSYAEKIFVIFQRLHSRDNFEGTGIGLAICKKIIENGGGRIWAESEPQKGSTFWILLPMEYDERNQLTSELSHL
jgi:signal transduction histidine kinase